MVRSMRSGATTRVAARCGPWRRITRAPTSGAAGRRCPPREDRCQLPPDRAVGLDGKNYAIGYTTLSKPTVEVYDLATDTWTGAPSGSAPLPTRGYRPLAAATGPDGKIYVFGRQTVLNYDRTVAVYDPRSNSWTTAGSMPDLGGIQAAVTGSDGKIYVVGGALSSIVPLAAYDPRSHRWSTQAPVPSSRYNLAAAAGSNGKIYILGGSYHGSDAPVHQVDVFTIPKSGAGH